VAFTLAVGLLLLALLPGGPRWLASIADLGSVADPTRHRRFLTAASFAAAFLSLGYIAFYLRGGPRAQDACAYWLQGRALSRGALSWALPDPIASFRASNLLFRAPDRLSGIFPPGYPLLLAMGFLVGAPMLVGPVLAATLVLATWFLAREVVAYSDGAADHPHRAEVIARAAAGLSIVSAALRYHTADALPYGACAVAMATSLAFALRARRTWHAPSFGVSGLAIGFLIASDPSAAMAVGVIVAVLAWGAPARGRSLSWGIAAALPGVLLLLAANHAATGHALASPAAAYDAAIGRGTLLAHGFDGLSTLRCLRQHLLDIANLEPLALLAAVPLLVAGKRRGALLTALVIGAHLILHVPARDGGLPAVPGRGPHWMDASSGFGAGLLVAVVPLEQVLMAIGLAHLWPRALPHAAMAALAFSVAGFACHASHAHEALAAGELGRPHFEPDVTREANVTHGLLFFEDDAGYELAHDPGASASHDIEAVRMRGDDHDRLLYDSLGHPPAHRYVVGVTGASVSGWVPANAGSDTWRFEAEADWPPLAQAGGTAEVVDMGDACASAGRALRITPASLASGDITSPVVASGARTRAEATVTLALPIPRGPVAPVIRMWMVSPRILQGKGAGGGIIRVVTEPAEQAVAEWRWDGDSEAQPACVDLPARAVDLGGEHARAWLVVRALGGTLWLDSTTLRLSTDHARTEPAAPRP
jgi:hypothetical protein